MSSDIWIFFLMMFLGLVFIILVFLVSYSIECIKRSMRLFYYKWILGNCRHICRFCKYHGDCLAEIYNK